MKATLFLFCIISLLYSIQGSHYRYGTISWTHLGNNRVSFTVTTGWRTSYFYNSSTPAPKVGNVLPLGDKFNFGDGTTAAIYPSISSFDHSVDAVISTATLVHQYPTPNNNSNPWIAYYGWFSRLNTLNNVAGGNWNLETTVDLARFSHSPVSAQLPIVQVSASPSQAIITIPVAASYDNGPLTYRLGSTWELCRTNLCKQPKQLTINSATGDLTWNVTGVNTGAWCVVVMIESGSLKIPVDFILNFTRIQGYCTNGCGKNCTINAHCASSCGVVGSTCIQQRVPVFIAPTPRENVTITARVGRLLKFNVTAWSADGTAVTVFINQGGTFPAGAGFAGAASGTNPTSQAVSWTPTSSQVGDSLLCFSAYSQINSATNPARVNSAPYCIPVTVEDCAPVTCASQNIFCGNISNGCGSTLNCGAPCSLYTILTSSTWALTTLGRTAGSLVVINSYDASTGPTPGQQWLISGSLIVYAGNQNMILGYDSVSSQLQLFDKTQLSATETSRFYWTFPTTPDGQMYMALTGSNKVMDIYYSQVVPASPIILYSPKNVTYAQNQEWAADNTSTPGVVGIRTALDGYYITVNGPLAHGTLIVASISPSGVANATGLTNAQKWILEGNQIVLASNPNLIIGYAPHDPTYGHRLQLQAKTSLTAVQLNTFLWTWVKVLPRWSFIYNTPGSPVATVDGSNSPGTPVIISVQITPSIASQKWKVARWP